MSIAPVGAIGAEPSQALKQVSQAVSNKADSVQLSSGTDKVSLGGNSFQASLEAPAQASNQGSQPGFVNSVLDGVYTEIDTLSSKMSEASNKTSPVDTYKNDVASQVDGLNPQTEVALNPEKNQAVEALSKTFDHAIFMAMVNQVVSGVSDTSRTLIRQS